MAEANFKGANFKEAVMSKAYAKVNINEWRSESGI